MSVAEYAVLFVLVAIMGAGLPGPGDAALIAATPLGRVAEAPDQAKVICFLASSDADYVTGLTIDVTGGQSG